MPDFKADVVIVGGGAAGFFAGLVCAEQYPGTRIVILERAAAPLGKVAVSGGGRCNVTNATFDPARLVAFYPRGGKALRGPFTRFGPQQMVDWFSARGVALKTEPDGRIFPQSDSSQTIIDCFLSQSQRLGVELHLLSGVTEIIPAGIGFSISLANGERWNTRRVLLATGGARPGYELARRLGHKIIEPVPSLFTFKIQDERISGLAGISVPNARLRLPAAKLEQKGPLLITHWGLSGPVVLRLSAWGARFLHEQDYQAEVRLVWLGEFNSDKVKDVFRRMRSEKGSQRMYQASPFAEIPLRLWERLAWVAGIRPNEHWGDAEKEQMERIENDLLDCPLHITGKGEFKEEFVTCGGVDLDEVDFRTMESRKAAGLYFAGEILDIDGLTGGFNFQAAWTTGWHAGRAMGKI